ncbi:MAG TPA: HlyD family efflux transporter periplasmic adaptor subunit [Woeseiaceae bacterium]|nr:HlyD family efflux transporter periplasmic adaptor subunit [Woeseiaceae bacterium]
MAGPLFRREALAARHRSWLGGISLAQPLPMWLLAAFAVAAAAAIVALLAAGEYTRRSRVAGQLVPDLGLVTVAAPVSGVVLRARPKEGEQVTRDQSLVIIGTPRATSETDDLTAGLLARLEERRAAVLAAAASARELLALQAEGHAAQLASERRELEAIGNAIGIERRRVRIAEELLAHFEKLSERGFVSELRLTQQQQASLERAAALQALERQRVVLERDILRTEQSLREAATQQAARAAASRRELAELGQERLRIEAGGEVLVQAPVDGTVASTLVERGQTVEAGQPILSLVPAGSVLRARLLVPSRAVGFIRPGDAVLLRYQAFPHQKFGHHRGTVLRISRNALSPEALAALDSSVQAREPYYRVLVELEAQSIVAYGRHEALRPGMLVEADILGERRTLYEWLLEPLYSLTGRLR